MGSRAARTFRHELYHRQGGLCYWCGLPMEVVDYSRASRFRRYPWATTQEHLLPYGHPQRERRWAIVGAHQFCNQLRAQVEWDVFWVYVCNPAMEQTYAAHRLPRRRLVSDLLRQAVAEIAGDALISGPGAHRTR